MLSRLHIKNIALIDDISIELSDGLNILSGETGAGKSIIIDSLNFVLGERADKSLIRYGQESAEVEAVFEVGESVANEIFDYLGVTEHDDTVVIKRVMSFGGKNDIRINGSFATVQMLKTVSAKLCDIHGQHEHQSILNVSGHIDILDKFDLNTIQPIKAEVEKAYVSYTDCIKALGKFGSGEERFARIDLLKYQIDEINEANFEDDEEEKVSSIRKKLQNSEKIVENMTFASKILSENQDGFNAVSGIYSAINYLTSISKYDERLDSLTERMESAKIELQDVSDTLSDYIKELEYDPQYADWIEKRYEQIKFFKRKYGCATLSELNLRLESMQAELAGLTNSDDEIMRLERERDRLYSELFDAAKNLSEQRRAASRRLESEIMNELSELGMKGTTFNISFNEMPDRDDFIDSCNANGFDKVEFLISPNVGEPLKPLAKIVSGGEMSRFMLAVKHIIARIDEIGTLVFDEIDTGISGKIADVVSKKLYNISRLSQVIAVTHLPQLASFADLNILITKSVSDGRTHTTLERLDSDGKITEISRLAGGVGDKGMLHAKEMIAYADNYKGLYK